MSLCVGHCQNRWLLYSLEVVRVYCLWVQTLDFSYFFSATTQWEEWVYISECFIGGPFVDLLIFCRIFRTLSIRYTNVLHIQKANKTCRISVVPIIQCTANVPWIILFIGIGMSNGRSGCRTISYLKYPGDIAKDARHVNHWPQIKDSCTNSLVTKCENAD